MKKRFKKVYIEITNNCNFNCSFCMPDSREKEFMSMEKFEHVISKIKDYTDYIYLHVKGEPLLHPEINEIIEYANKQGLFVNITTNGSIINNLTTKKIRQINYSIQSMNNSEEIKQTIMKLKEYIEDTNIYLSLRLWTNKSKKNIEIQEMLKKEFDIEELVDKKKVGENIFLSIEKEFEWPDLNNEVMQKEGFCYGLKSHIGILVDGTIIPCCLDHEGNIDLGNIFEEELEDILNKQKTKDILEGFRQRKKVEELCQKCSFIDNLSEI